MVCLYRPLSRITFSTNDLGTLSTTEHASDPSAAPLCPLIIYTECHCQPLSIGLSLINYYQLQLKGRSCPLTRDCLVPSQPSSCTLSTGSEPHSTSTGLHQELPMTKGGFGTGTHNISLPRLSRLRPPIDTQSTPHPRSPSLGLFPLRVN